MPIDRQRTWNPPCWTCPLDCLVGERTIFRIGKVTRRNQRDEVLAGPAGPFLKTHQIAIRLGKQTTGAGALKGEDTGEDAPGRHDSLHGLNRRYPTLSPQSNRTFLSPKNDRSSVYRRSRFHARPIRGSLPDGTGVEPFTTINRPARVHTTIARLVSLLWCGRGARETAWRRRSWETIRRGG